MTIWFDMDGTLADLYGVENWLEDLRNERVRPYAEARPLVDTERFSELALLLQTLGVKIGIISWSSLGGSAEYNKMVKRAKVEWLKNNFDVTFDEVHVVKYGTKKNKFAEDFEIIFDDDERVREKWNGFSYNPQEIDINEILEKIINVII